MFVKSRCQRTGQAQCVLKVLRSVASIAHKAACHAQHFIILRGKIYGNRRAQFFLRGLFSQQLGVAGAEANLHMAFPLAKLAGFIDIFAIQRARAGLGI